MDYETISGINPGIVYASITGYGQTGPYRDRAGYDVIVEAYVTPTGRDILTTLKNHSEMGLMHITGHRDGPPAKVGVAITDLTTGLYASNSVLAALLDRTKNGKGQHIDVALADCQVASLANIASSALISGKPDSGRWGTAHRRNTIATIPQVNADVNSLHRSLSRLQNRRRRCDIWWRQRPPLPHHVREVARAQPSE